MVHLRVSFDDDEIERRDLTGPLVIGRWAGCDLAVRDILLSRRHCRIESDEGSGWRVRDLGSKNGTLLNGRRLGEIGESLRAEDELTLGRLTVRIGAGSLEEVGLTPLHRVAARPADPGESMTGTCMGFAYLEPGELSESSPNTIQRALPRPEPRLPAAYDRENIHALLTAIASSSWDSIYAEARRPLPTPMVRVVSEEPETGVRKVRPRTPMEAVAAAAPVRMARHPRRRVTPMALVWIVLIGLLACKGYFDVRVTTAAPAPVVEVIAPVPEAQPASPLGPMACQIAATAIQLLI